MAPPSFLQLLSPEDIMVFLDTGVCIAMLRLQG